MKFIAIAEDGGPGNAPVSVRLFAVPEADGEDTDVERFKYEVCEEILRRDGVPAEILAEAEEGDIDEGMDANGLRAFIVEPETLK